MTPSSECSLVLRLNEDVIHQIAEELRVQHVLGPLSMTCRRMHQLCAPILFRACEVSARRPIREVSFLPESLWPYVRMLTLIDGCPDIGAMRRHEDSPAAIRRSTVYSEDSLLCGVYDNAFLGEALRKMPQLYAVTFKLYPYYGYGHGLPWRLLRTILTIPQLREFTCDAHFFSPRPPSAQELSLPGPPPLTSFRYVLEDHRKPPRTYPSEREALDLVLKTFHASLETLELPTEATPFHTLRSLPWPSLRVLKLRGEFDGLDDPSIPLVTAFSGMSRLHTLELALALPPGTPPRSIWPSGLLATYPWPDLRRLVVSFPLPDDQLYSHLPSTIRSFVLRYTPHLATHRWVNDSPPWRSPAVPARDILRILHTLRAPELEELTVEYHQDDEEADLLRYIATAFPTLCALKVLRYRAEGVREVDAAGLARTLATHPRLHTLSVYLDPRDLSDVPRSYYADGPMRAGYPELDQSLYREVLDNTANVLAEHLGPSVALIRQLRPMWRPRQWAVYKVIRSEHGRSRAEYDCLPKRGAEEPHTAWIMMAHDMPRRDVGHPPVIVQPWPVLNTGTDG